MLAETADLGRVDLSVVDRVVEDLLDRGADISRLMLVGAHCRNVWAQALGDSSPMVHTHDVDLGIAVSSMQQWSDLTSQLPKVRGSSSGIAFTVAGMHVDVMPFGHEVERPAGTVTPPPRPDEPFSVLGFESVFRSGVKVALPLGKDLTLPTPEGFALLKIAALHDRLAWNQLKDAQDLAVVRRWYLGSTYLADRLYDEDLLPVLLAEGVDPSLALMRLWGQVCAALLGVEERRILLDQWSVCVSPLERVWAAEKRDRVWRAQAVALVEAFDRGIRAT